VVKYGAMKNRLYSTQDCENLGIREIRDLYKKHVNPALENIFGSFASGQIEVAKAEGVKIVAKDGTEYLDVTGGIGVLNIGHNHPRIIAARQRYLESTKMEVHKTFFSPYLAALSHNLAAVLPGKLNYPYFCNSGAEAVEGAMKLAYKYHGGNRDYILHSDISFHGKLLGSASITASKEIYFKFPTLPNVDQFKYNNIESVKDKINSLKSGYALLSKTVVGCRVEGSITRVAVGF